jgi:TRAP-type C4-dicarboxylate transport system permease small subunit
LKLEKVINVGIPIICGVLLILMVAFTFMQIILREVFNFSLSWSDEVSQFCMTWLALLGAIWCDKNSRHLNTGLILHRKLNKNLICLIDAILALIIIGIAAVVAYQTAILSFASMSTESLSLPWLKRGYVYIVLPLAMLGTCYYYLKSFLKNILVIFTK